ncbi:MAG: putative glycoside hydrolase [Minisyncoccota bacterium]
MSRGSKRKVWFSLGLGLLVICILLLTLPFLFKVSYSNVLGNNETDLGVGTTTPVFVATHVETPDAVKGIYITACVAGTPSWRDNLKKLIETTELNSVVIDIKDYSGTISFLDPDFPQENVSGCRVADMKEFVAELHKSNIYVIGRITVFQDPFYTKLHPELAVKKKSDGGVWKDHKGLAFIDVGAKPYWDYIIDLSKKSYALGFDELNFDYIRYPSDGNMKDTNYTWTIGSSTKPQMLRSFFSYLHENLKDTGVKISADLFGMTTTNNDDLGIGQVLEDTLEYFDFVDPMVYPSHYPPTWNGFKNPAEHPYEVIKLSMQGGIDKEQALQVSLGISTSTPSKLRPWLQDFDMGANYGVAEVRAQIKATYDIGLTSWLIWDAGNKYTTGAFLAE